MKSWCTFTSQEQIPDLIKMHVHEIKRPNTAPSRSQELPRTLPHDLSPWLNSVHWVSDCSTLTPCWDFSPTFWAQKIWLFSEISASVCEQRTSPGSLRLIPLPSLPHLPGDCFMGKLEGWPELARFSELVSWHHDVSSDALSLFDGSVFA